MFLMLTCLFFINSSNIFAIDDDNFIVLSKEEKYFKTTTMYDDYMSINVNQVLPLSYTEEITKQEYDNYSTSDLNPNTNVTVETTYKKLTSSIMTNGNYYRYRANLEWKNFPKVRSYDTIAIGYYSSVKPLFDPYFEQTYCLKGEGCKTINTFYPQIFTSGSSATFKVPTGELTSLTQTLDVDVTKAVNSTIISQKATGDYAHAVKTVSVEKAKDFTVSNIGITFASSSEDYFDNMGYAQATWSGSW